MQSYPHPEAAELVKLSPAKKQARFYRLEIWPDLFGGFSLAREYGRIGQPGRLQLNPFPEIDTARKAFCPHRQQEAAARVCPDRKAIRRLGARPDPVGDNWTPPVQPESVPCYRS